MTADEDIRWHPRTARAAGMTHTWVTTADELLALAEDVQAQGWDCIAIGYAPNRPVSRCTAARMQSAGVPAASTPAEVATAFDAVIDRIERSAYTTQTDSAEADRHPLLLVVGEISLGAFKAAESHALEYIASCGRAADVHLAVNESLRPKTSPIFQDHVLCNYGGSI